MHAVYYLSMITPVGVKFQSYIIIKVKSISHFQFLFRLIGIVVGTHISWCSSLVDWSALLWNMNGFALFFRRRLWVLQQHQRSRVSFVKEIFRLSFCMLWFSVIEICYCCLITGRELMVQLNVVDVPNIVMLSVSYCWLGFKAFYFWTSNGFFLYLHFNWSSLCFEFQI